MRWNLKFLFFTAAIRSAHLQASKPIESKQHSFTPNHIQDLIYLKNKVKRKYNKTLNPLHKANYYRLQELKKALKKNSQKSWTKRLEALNTTDNSLCQCQKFFRKKRSNIPNLNSSCIAYNDEQKANLFALTLKNNFIENKRPDDKIYPIDDNITNTLEDFLSHSPPFPIAPTNPDEITDYVRRLPNNKAPGSDSITNNMASPLQGPNAFRYGRDGGTFHVPFPKDVKFLYWSSQDIQEIIFHGSGEALANLSTSSLIPIPL
ncbi:RNA-directed DNA polymerase from mobile element jockey [Trichonephila clavipes]|nr:RNA-directed DNA polymerase from mobile element jockey [Trichonephila clavipes]